MARIASTADYPTIGQESATNQGIRIIPGADQWTETTPGHAPAPEAGTDHDMDTEMWETDNDT